MGKHWLVPQSDKPKETHFNSLVAIQSIINPYHPHLISEYTPADSKMRRVECAAAVDTIQLHKIVAY